MKFTLCIPTYNEEEIIATTISDLSAVLSHFLNNLDWDIVVADNGSDDMTKDRVLSVDSVRVSVLTISERGKGAAIRAAAATSDSDFFGFIDADLSADPLVIPEMLTMLQFGECDIVVGSRFLDSRAVQRGMWRSFSSRAFNFLQGLILGVEVGDTQCGLKIMNKKGVDALRRCAEKSWFLDLELLALAEKLDLKIKEVPVRWQEFHYEGRTSKLKVFRDGFSAIIAMLRMRVRLSKI